MRPILRFVLLLLEIFTLLSPFRVQNNGNIDSAAPVISVIMAEDDVRVPNFEDLPLVSAISPARNDGTLDVERCATLHNFLVRYGWTGAGHYLADISRANFFDKHENDAG